MVVGDHTYEKGEAIMSFIGIDIGTSFIKGAVLNTDALSISHIRRIPFPDPLPGLPPLYKEYDPHTVLRR